MYDPAEDSLLLTENLAVGEGDLVLGLGTGCGLLAFLAAKKTKSARLEDPIGTNFKITNDG